MVINRETLLVDIEQAGDQATGYRSVNIEHWLGFPLVARDKGKTRITLTELSYLNLCLQGVLLFEGSPTQGWHFTSRQTIISMSIGQAANLN